MQRQRSTGLFIFIMALGLIGYGSAGYRGHGDHSIHLESAWVRRTPPLAQQEQGGHGGSGLNPNNTAVYVTIKNHGHEPDALLSAVTTVATSVELHETIEKDGKRMMQPRSQFDIPTGGTLEMKPGSYHLMLLGLKQALNPGDTVPVMLTFQKAGRLSIEAPVK